MSQIQTELAEGQLKTNPLMVMTSCPIPLDEVVIQP